MFYNCISITRSQNEIISDEQIALMVYSIVIIVFLVVMFVLFFSAFQKRKNKLLIDKIQREREFEEEFVKTQTEVQEQTLKNVGQELHDNVGQLLSIANMQLSLVSSLTKDSIKSKVDEAKNVVSDAIKEVRGLSKVLNSEVVLNLGFQESINTELERLNRMNILKAELFRSGDKGVCKNNQDTIILFRILQEFISNTVKYSKATELKIRLDYSPNSLLITAEDNGIGFDKNNVELGNGLENMQQRIREIGGEISITSKVNEGTIIKIKLEKNRTNAV